MDLRDGESGLRLKSYLLWFSGYTIDKCIRKKNPIVFRFNVEFKLCKYNNNIFTSDLTKIKLQHKINNLRLYYIEQGSIIFESLLDCYDLSFAFKRKHTQSVPQIHFNML